MFAFVYVCVLVYVIVSSWVSVHVHVHVRVHVHVHVRLQMCVCVPVHLCECVICACVWRRLACLLLHIHVAWASAICREKKARILVTASESPQKQTGNFGRRQNCQAESVSRVYGNCFTLLCMERGLF